MRALRLFAITVFSLALGGGAVQEFVIPGLRAGQTQPFVIGFAGIVVGLLCVASALLLWRRSAAAPRLAAVAGAAAIVFHVFAALPPRNVGILALLVALALGLLFFWEAGLGRHGKVVRAARS